MDFGLLQDDGNAEKGTLSKLDLLARLYGCADGWYHFVNFSGRKGEIVLEHLFQYGIQCTIVIQVKKAAPDCNIFLRPLFFWAGLIIVLSCLFLSLWQRAGDLIAGGVETPHLVSPEHLIAPGCPLPIWAFSEVWKGYGIEAAATFI